MTNSEFVEMREAARVFLLDRQEIAVVDETGLDTCLEHLEVGLLERFWDVSLRINLLHLLINDS